MRHRRGLLRRRGGVGASTLATSLAWLFSADEKLPTALLDLDVHFGTGALALDLEPGRGLTDAIENILPDDPVSASPADRRRRAEQVLEQLGLDAGQGAVNQPAQGWLGRLLALDVGYQAVNCRQVPGLLAVLDGRGGAVVWTTLATVAWLAFLFTLAAGTLRALFIVRAFKPDVIVGTGGRHAMYRDAILGRYRERLRGGTVEIKA